MAQNVETFDAYFRRADLDRDGRISGAEAVAFFQGSNLPKQTLAQDFEHSKNGHDFFGSNDFELMPIRTSSSHGGDDPSKKNAKDTVSITDSIPSSPLFNSTPKSSRGLDEPSFDSFSRFDSFKTNDNSSFFPQPGSLARFDSIGSTMDSDHTRGFPAFDDNGPFGSSDPFKAIENRTPKRGTDNWNVF